MRKTFSVNISFNNVRLDRFISDNCGISRSKAVELILRRFVRINGIFITKQSYKVKITQNVEVEFEDPTG